MSAKPAQIPTWATATNFDVGGQTYSGTPTKVAPTGTRRARGWEPKQKPPAQVENYERNIIGLWCQYLSDGDLSGDHSIDGALEVTGDVAIDGDLTLGGALYHGDRVRSIAGTLGQFDANGGTGGVNRPLGGYAGTIRISTTFDGSPVITFSTPLETGQRVKSISFGAFKSSGSGSTSDAIPNVDCFTVNANQTTTTIGTLTGVDLTESLTLFTIDVTDTTMSNARTLVVGFAGAIVQNTEIQYVTVTYDAPVPP